MHRVSSSWSSGAFPTYTYRSPASRPISAARRRVATGVGGTSRIRKAGWNRLTCHGVSGPRVPAIQPASARSSPSVSLRPGMTSVVSSSQMPASRYATIASSTWLSRAPHRRR